MARLPIIEDREDLPDDVRTVFSGARNLLGFVSNLTRTLTHVPALAGWLIPMIASIQRGGSDANLDPRIKELAIIRTSVLNQCVF
jgi:hypothetical protein